MADGTLRFDTRIDQSGFNSGIKTLGSIAKTGVKAIAGALAAAGTALLGATAAGVKYNAQMEQYTESFATMLGGAQKAQSMINDLKTLAAKTPLEMTDIAKGSQTLLAFGYSAEKTAPTLKMIGDVALGDAERMQSLTLAFAQCQSTGKLMGQDLLQMVNAGFNPLNEMSKTTGKSVAVLKEEMSKGAISAQMVEDAFKSATSVGGQFFGAMEAQSRTFNGQLSTLKDNAQALLGSLTGGITDKLKAKALPALNEYISRLQTAFDKNGVAGAVSEFGNVLADAVTQITKTAPRWIEAGSSLIKSFLAGLRKKSKDLAKGALDLMMSFKDSVFQLLPEIITTGASLVTNLLKGFSEKLPELIPEAIDKLFEIVTQLVVDARKLVKVGFKLVEGIVTGILNAIPELFMGIGDVLVAAFTNKFDIAAAVEEELADVTAAYDATVSRIQEASDTLGTSLEGVLADEAYGAELVAKLEELAAKTTRTAAESAELANVVAQLNALYPSLGLAIDDETGAINMSTEALRRNIDALVDRARADAYVDKIKANTASIIDLERQQADIATKYKAAIEKKTAAEKKAAEITALHNKLTAENTPALAENRAALEALGIEYDETATTTENYDRIVWELAAMSFEAAEAAEVQRGVASRLAEVYAEQGGQISELNSQNEEFIAGYDGVASALNSTAEAAGEADDNMKDLSLTWGETASEIASATISAEELESLGLTADEASAKFDELKESTREMFGVVREEGGLTAAQLTANLEQNTADTTQWATDIKDLYQRLPSDLVAVLEEKGPAIGETVHNLSTEEDLQPLIDAWQAGGAGALEAMGLELGGTEDTVVETVQSGAAAMTADKSLDTAAKTKIKTVKTSMAAEVTAQNFGQVGSNIVSGMINGMGQMQGALEAKAASLAAAAAAAMRRALDSHSPSKVFEKIGVSVPEGAALGISKGAPYVAEAMARINSTMIGGYGSYGDSNVTNYNTTTRSQTVQFYRPEESPAETARALERLERSLAYGV